MPKVKLGEVNISYVEAGKGDALLFVSGLIGLAKVWEFQFPHFSARYRCVSFDHRGSGESDKTEEGYSTAQIAADVIALMDELGIEKAHVVGASTGGCILQNLCLDHPDRVRCAVFTNTWTKADEYFTRLQVARRRLLQGFGQDAYIEASSLWTGGPAMFRNNLDVMLDLEKRQRETAADTDILTARINMTLEHDRFAEISAINKPALVIGAKDDPLTPPYFAEDLSGLLQNAELLLLEYGGHNSYRRNTDAWNSGVDAFLQKNEAKA